MFSSSSIIDNLNTIKGLEYKKLCRLLKITKKNDKAKLDIALLALERLEIIKKTENNEFISIKDDNHITAKIRCSSKGYCFAVRENSSEDIYIKENLLNNAWNGDKVLVRIIKEGVRRRSPEGVVDCILERSNSILLGRVELFKDEVYGIPIDDRILAKIKLPKSDNEYLYKPEEKNIVKIEIDKFPIGQLEGYGHVVKELKLITNEEIDNEFVLSKNNLILLNELKDIEIKKSELNERLDLTKKNSFMFKSWKYDNCPLLPIFQIEKDKKGNYKLWIHSNNVGERIDFTNKNLLDNLSKSFESFPISEEWQYFLNKELYNLTEFKNDQINNAISLCISLSEELEITNWSFHLTKVKCATTIENNHLEAINNNKTKARVTSRILKPIKDYLEDIEQIIKISKKFREDQLKSGKFEVQINNNNIESLNEFFAHNPGNYIKEYFEPLNDNDIQTYISPILHVADNIWFKHSYNLGIINASYENQDLEYVNVNEIIRNSQLFDNKLELNDEGSLTLNNVFNMNIDENQKRIINKQLINTLKLNKVKLIYRNRDSDIREENCISPWTLPSLDYINLINQYNIYNLIKNGISSYKNAEEINLLEKGTWKDVNWEIINANNNKITNILFTDILIDRVNEYKEKANLYKSNLISIKQIRQAEKLLGEKFNGLITSVQSYGFFVELPELFIEGLVHVSTLNNDWYEYRSRQNILVGRKSKNTFRIGDNINVKIIKVDILKYQIDLEIV